MQDGRYFEGMQLRSDTGAQGWVPLSIVTAPADFGGVKPAIIFLHATGALLYDNRLRGFGSVLLCPLSQSRALLSGRALPSLSARSVRCTASSSQYRNWLEDANPPATSCWWLLLLVVHTGTFSPSGVLVQARTRRACSSAWSERQVWGS